MKRKDLPHTKITQLEHLDHLGQANGLAPEDPPLRENPGLKLVRTKSGDDKARWQDISVSTTAC